MKKIVFVSIILACLSIAYYFAIFLPQTLTRIVQNQVRTADKTDLELQEKCAKLAKEYFNNQHFTEGLPTYTCHYNKKYNKFFVHIKLMIVSTNNNGKESVIISEWITDLLSNKEFTGYIKTSNGKGMITNDGETVEAKVGQWDDIVKQYMED